MSDQVQGSLEFVSVSPNVGYMERSRLACISVLHDVAKNLVYGAASYRFT